MRIDDAVVSQVEAQVLRVHASSRRLAGKVALITGSGFDGASLGTGAAMAVLFALQGASVMIIDREASRAGATKGLIERFGGSAKMIVGDICSDDFQATICDPISLPGGRLDVLVNNVGIVGTRELSDLDRDKWDVVFNTNLGAAVQLSRLAMPALRCAQGSVIHISSLAGLRAAGSLAYGVSKAALIGLTRESALSEGLSGVRVNCICPGHLSTPMMQAVSSSMRAQRRRAAFLPTEGTAWDVAWCALFLASNEARWITGAILPVDGGASQALPLTMAARIMQEQD